MSLPALALLSACHTGAAIPGYDGSAVTATSGHGPDVPSPAETARAFRAFEAAAPAIFPPAAIRDLHVVLSNLDIDYDEAASCTANSCVRGETIEPTLVWVQVDSDRHDVSTNALIHELVHVVFWHAYHNPDADHEGPDPDIWHHEHTIWIAEVMASLSS